MNLAKTHFILLPLWLTLADAAPTPMLTVQVGAPALPPTPLVNHADDWRYRKGNSEPQADWKTASDSSLDGTWLTGPGGFGYADGDDATMLNDMLNTYNTVYIRRSFEIPAGVDASRRVQLVMDWDDGFVVYLDGVEVARSPNVAVANPLFNSQTVAGQNHEASAGASGNPPTSYDLGSVGALLTPGTHILAVHGLNSDTASSDFSLIADLRLVGGASVASGGPLFAIVNSASTPLSGTNTIPGSSRVTVNGEEAAFNPATGEWSLSKTLTPGLNNLFVAALSSEGALLASTNRDVFFNQSVVGMGGDVMGTTPFNSVTWAFGPSTVVVTNTVTVKSGTLLLISNTLAVLFAPGASLRVESGAALIVKDDGFNVHPGKPIFFGPSDGTTPWGDLAAIGTNALLIVHDAEVVAGQVRALQGGAVRMEDSIIRDLPGAGREIIAAVGGAELTLRRIYAARFGEMDSRDTPVLIEDSLLEQFAIDGLDIKTTNNSPLIVRRTTLRRADPNNTNADAIDFGPGAGTVENCLIHSFPDKGVSVGGASGTRVSGSLIYNCGIGLSAYASSNLVYVNTTIAGCSNGVYFRDNPTPAFGAATNLIVWGNTNNVAISNTSTIEISYSDIEGASVFPGPGNINSDPMFVNAAARDFQLAAGSPAAGTAFGGGNMGAIFPVGGLPGEPINLAALVNGTGEIRLHWQDDSENEAGFELQRSLDGVAWEYLAAVGPGISDYTDVTAELRQRYFYRARSFNSAGVSRFSNPAGAVRQEPIRFVGGTLAANAIWSPADGMIVVLSDVIVPGGVSLTVLPGTMVKVTNNASILAVGGGVIDIQGTTENKVRLLPLNGTNLWGQLSAQFAGSSLTLRHADVSYAQVSIYSNAVGLIEDTFIHDYRRAGAPILVAPILVTHFAAPTTIRRCHVREYHETLFRNGVLTIEECLFDYIHGDGLDFDAAQPGTVLRNCTFRHGQFGNVDAVDVGPGDLPGSFDVRIENCMMYDFPFDKGVSVGDRGSSFGTIVSNCFIYSCLSGVMAKDLCEVSVRNCTIVNNNWGFTNYNKVDPSSLTGGGILTNCYNNILWNNGITISTANDGRLYADHNIFGNTNWPGEGNFDLDPLFVNPTGRDYRLTPNSPGIETGRDGADMGARFPVGAAMVLSHPRIEQIDTAGPDVVVRFWADNEKTYSLLSSPMADGGTWTKLVDVPLDAAPRFLSVTNTIAPGNRFYRLVTPAQP